MAQDNLSVKLHAKIERAILRISVRSSFSAAGRQDDSGEVEKRLAWRAVHSAHVVSAHVVAAVDERRADRHGDVGEKA